MKSIHTFDVFAPTDEQEEAMNKKRGGHYRRGKTKKWITLLSVLLRYFPTTIIQGSHLYMIRQKSFIN